MTQWEKIKKNESYKQFKEISEASHNFSFIPRLILNIDKKTNTKIKIRESNDKEQIY